jgi:hypothetical protein
MPAWGLWLRRLARLFLLRKEKENSRTRRHQGNHAEDGNEKHQIAERRHATRSLCARLAGKSRVERDRRAGQEERHEIAAGNDRDFEDWLHDLMRGGA